MLKIIFATVALFLVLVSSSTTSLASTPATITVRPTADNSLLINPGKGFVEYGGTEPDVTPNYIGAGYNRFNWSSIEPKDGVYDWSSIDSFIADFAKYGKKSAFGVMCVSTGIGCEYVTPKWVFDDGASALTITDSSTPTGTQIIPKHWDDPIFLAKLHDFIAALGKRYDGDPNVEWIDVRDYGNWGEGHIGMLGNDPNIILTPPANLQANYFQPYFTAFQHTQLIIPWGSDYYSAVYDWAVSKGAGMRRDGILSQWSKSGSECMRAFGHAPAVFEYCWGYEETKKNGYWGTDKLMSYINGGKPSFMQWDNQIFKENHDFILTLGNKIGYHFVLEQVIVPTGVRQNKPFMLSLRWLNDGVAPLYEPCFVAAALLDQTDRVLASCWLDKSNPANWAPGQLTNESLTASMHGVSSGTYKFAIGLFTSKANSSPDYRLGIQGRTETGWYIIEPMMTVK